MKTQEVGIAAARHDDKRSVEVHLPLQPKSGPDHRPAAPNATVNRDNTVGIHNLQLQTEPVPWRATLAGSSVLLHQHLDGTFTISYGPQHLGPRSARACQTLSQS